MNNLATWAQSFGFSIKNEKDLAGNAFEVPKLPELVPSLVQAMTLRPYGYIGFPKDDTPEMLLGNAVVGYLDPRLLEGLKSLVEGEAATYSDKYALTVKLGGVEVYRDEGDFQTTVASADNTEKILKSIFQYLMTISGQIDALNSAFKAHTHPYTWTDPAGAGNTSPANNASSAPPDAYFQSTSSTYPTLIKGNTYNDNKQVYIQDGTNIITDIP